MPYEIKGKTKTSNGEGSKKHESGSVKQRQRGLTQSESILELQKTIGNEAVQGIIQAMLEANQDVVQSHVTGAYGVCLARGDGANPPIMAKEADLRAMLRQEYEKVGLPGDMIDFIMGTIPGNLTEEEYIRLTQRIEDISALDGEAATANKEKLGLPETLEKIEADKFTSWAFLYYIFKIVTRKKGILRYLLGTDKMWRTEMLAERKKVLEEMTSNLDKVKRRKKGKLKASRRAERDAGKAKRGEKTKLKAKASASQGKAASLELQERALIKQAQKLEQGVSKSERSVAKAAAQKSEGAATKVIRKVVDALPEKAGTTVSSGLKKLEEIGAKRVISEAMEQRIKKFMAERFPKVVEARLARLLTKAAGKRAASLAPVVGWGFAAHEGYKGAKDIAKGNIGRGFAGIGLAIGDVAADFLHLGDAVSGVGGTALSLGAQGAIVAGYIKLELERTKDLLEELGREIEQNQALPPDERLKDYYDFDDEDIQELKKAFAE